MKENKDMCMHFVCLKRWGTQDKRGKKKVQDARKWKQLHFALSRQVSKQN